MRIERQSRRKPAGVELLARMLRLRAACRRPRPLRPRAARGRVRTPRAAAGAGAAAGDSLADVAGRRPDPRRRPPGGPLQLARGAATVEPCGDRPVDRQIGPSPDREPGRPYPPRPSRGGPTARPFAEIAVADLDGLIDRALAEDLGGGDITTEAVVPATACGIAEVVVREAGVVAGLDIAMAVLRRL